MSSGDRWVPVASAAERAAKLAIVGALSAVLACGGPDHGAGAEPAVAADVVDQLETAGAAEVIVSLRAPAQTSPFGVDDDGLMERLEERAPQ